MQRLTWKKLWFRKVRSKGAVLVLVWTVLAYGCYFSTIQLSSEGLPDFMSGVPGVVSVIIFILCCPFAGWLADVHFGRYKMMRAGLWLMWVGSIMGVATQLVQFQAPTASTLLNYTAMVLAGVFITIGFTAFIVNALPFGTDQMPDASSEEISAFIHWFVFAIFSGESIAPLGNLIHSCTNASYTILSLIPLVLLSFALCSDFLFKLCLKIEPESRNPLKLVLQVLKYTATHKYPARRSALTYCEDKKPSRIDHAKSKYGGPFTTEEVENVKTFFRMLVVIASMCTFLLPASLYLFSRTTLQGHFSHSTGLSYCSEVFLSWSYSEPILIAISIPLYEVGIYPIIRKWLPTMLKRIAISIVLSVILSIMWLTEDTLQHIKHPSLPCMFTSNGSSIVHTNYIWMDIPSNVLTALQYMLFNVAFFEFICAQAPYNMKGLLIGTAFSISYAVLPVGYAIFVAWDFGWRTAYTNAPLSCGFWFFLFLILTDIVGLLILCIVAKWYKRRERDEPANQQSVVEEVYERYCAQLQQDST